MWSRLSQTNINARWCFPPDERRGPSTLSPPWEPQPPQCARGEQSLLPAEDGGGDAVWRWSGGLQRHKRPTRMDLEESGERNLFPCLRLEEVWSISGHFWLASAAPFAGRSPGLFFLSGIHRLHSELSDRRVGVKKKKVDENVGYKGKSCGESSAHEPQG